MKRFGIILAAAGLLTFGCSKMGGLFPSPDRTSRPAVIHTPAASEFPQADLSGEWRVFYSWGCGSFSETTWTLNPDGTFYAPSINRGGTWKVEGKEFVLSFPYSPFVVYTGEVDVAAGTIAGTMAGDDGSRGCWNARKETPATGSPGLPVESSDR